MEVKKQNRQINFNCIYCLCCLAFETVNTSNVLIELRWAHTKQPAFLLSLIFCISFKFTRGLNISLNVAVINVHTCRDLHQLFCLFLVCTVIRYNLVLVRSCQCKSLPRVLFSFMTFSSVDTIIFDSRVLGFAAGDMFLVVLASIMHK